MNILLTCAGRRNYLVRYFRAALASDGLVLAADASLAAPALQEADRAFRVSRISSPGYVDELVALCREQQVSLLLSLNDLELPVLAEQRERFSAVGTTLVVSSTEVVDVCFDKRRTAQWLNAHGMVAPRTYDSLEAALTALQHGELCYPLVLKPRWGTASIGVHIAEDETELRLMHSLLTRQLARTFLHSFYETDRSHAILFQERVAGVEYGLDVVNDLGGRYVCTLARRKLAMRAGETDQAITVQDALLDALGARIGQALGHVGNLDCDVFLSGDKATVLEMNPRFGGGYPFSHAAGADIPAALVAWARGAEPQPSWLQVRPGVAAAKYSEVIVTASPDTTE